ncbi:MAG: hypothetical protein PHU25_08960 [Deltaproteobacteria bacterium]|nr:hypothetical protein [Deltaproteobacteria bacterium]
MTGQGANPGTSGGAVFPPRCPGLVAGAIACLCLLVAASAAAQPEAQAAGVAVGPVLGDVSPELEALLSASLATVVAEKGRTVAPGQTATLALVLDARATDDGVALVLVLIDANGREHGRRETQATRASADAEARELARQLLEQPVPPAPPATPEPSATPAPPAPPQEPETPPSTVATDDQGPPAPPLRNVAVGSVSGDVSFDLATALMESVSLALADSGRAAPPGEAAAFTLTVDVRNRNGTLALAVALVDAKNREVARRETETTRKDADAEARELARRILAGPMPEGPLARPLFVASPSFVAPPPPAMPALYTDWPEVKSARLLAGGIALVTHVGVTAWAALSFYAVAGMGTYHDRVTHSAHEDLMANFQVIWPYGTPVVGAISAVVGTVAYTILFNKAPWCRTSGFGVFLGGMIGAALATGATFLTGMADSPEATIGVSVASLVIFPLVGEMLLGWVFEEPWTAPRRASSVEDVP